MGIFDKRKKKSESPTDNATAVQTSVNSSHPYYSLTSYMPMGAESRVYAQLRNAVPILDAAINKIVRLTEGFTFETGDDSLNESMNSYFENINVGGNQRGLSAFISNYLNQLLTFGTAIGEMVVNEQGLYALYNSSLESIVLEDVIRFELACVYVIIENIPLRRKIFGFLFLFWHSLYTFHS